FDRDTVIFGEVGLSGEVRSVGMSDRRLSEAEKLGFSRAVIPAGSRSPGTKGKIEITGVRNVYDVMGLI
ncbi:MAG: DNA repair protein RadA, partial [Lachnospiraceae bacterium]|nr:DNA repair protein RadA [Lachnospiraceae bacterium]